MSNMYQMMRRMETTTPPAPQLQSTRSSGSRMSATNLEHDASECNSRGIVKSPSNDSSSRKSMTTSTTQQQPLSQMTISFRNKKTNKETTTTSADPVVDDHRPPPSTAPQKKKNIEPHLEEPEEEEANNVRQSFRSISSARDRTRIPADAYSLESDPAIALGLVKQSKPPTRVSSLGDSYGDTASNTSSDDSSSDDAPQFSPRSTMIPPSPSSSSIIKEQAQHRSSSLQTPLARAMMDDFSTDDPTVFEDLNSEVSPDFDACFRNTNLLMDDAITVDGCGDTVVSEQETVGEATIVEDEAFSGELWKSMRQQREAPTQDRRTSYSKYRDLLQTSTQKRCSVFQRRGSNGDESVGAPPVHHHVVEENVKTVDGVRFVPVQRTSAHRHHAQHQPRRTSSTAQPSSRRTSSSNNNMADMYDKIDQRVQQLLIGDSTRLNKLQQQLHDLKVAKHEQDRLQHAHVQEEQHHEEECWSPTKNTLYTGHDDENDGFGYF